MTKVDLKNKLIKIINSSDDTFLKLVNALHNSYQSNNKSDFFDELPSEIQDLLLESRNQVKKNKLHLHSDIIAEYREKYRTA